SSMAGPVPVPWRRGGLSVVMGPGHLPGSARRTAVRARPLAMRASGGRGRADRRPTQPRDPPRQAVRVKGRRDRPSAAETGPRAGPGRGGRVEWPGARALLAGGWGSIGRGGVPAGVSRRAQSCEPRPAVLTRRPERARRAEGSIRELAAILGSHLAP